jgi:hypothetical protein
MSYEGPGRNPKTGDVPTYDIEEIDIPGLVRLDLVPKMDGFRIFQVIDSSDIQIGTNACLEFKFTRR